MDKQEELKQAVEALTDEDIEKLSAGLLITKGLRIARIVGFVGSGLVGTAAIAAGVVGIAGAVKYGDGGYYFREGANRIREKGEEMIKSKIPLK